MEAKPRRHWFTFSLRTLFVVVTILSLWLGWQLKIVRERKAIIAALTKPADVATYFVTVEGLESNLSQPVTPGEYDHVRVSWIRRLLGDQSYSQISVRSTVDRGVLEQAELAFPEATFVVFNKNAWTENMWIESSRDSLYAPADKREPNIGDFFKTGLTKKD